MIIIKGQSGFGDAIYLRVIVEWLLTHRPNEYLILNNYPDVFFNLPVKIQPLDRKTKVNYYFSYLRYKNNITTQFSDICRSCNLPKIEFKSELINNISTKKTLVIPPYNPMNGVQTSLEMKPDFNEFMEYISQYKNLDFILQKKSFSELVHVFNEADLVISQVGWPIPLAQMLHRPVITIFTNRALNSSNNFISSIRPYKIQENNTTFIKILS